VLKFEAALLIAAGMSDEEIQFIGNLVDALVATLLANGTTEEPADGPVRSRPDASFQRRSL
jgi:hypothetical protein